MKHVKLPAIEVRARVKDLSLVRLHALKFSSSSFEKSIRKYVREVRKAKTLADIDQQMQILKP